MQSKTNKTINLVVGVVMPVVVIAITILLFFMYKPGEPGTLFYLNLFYTILLEIIAFGYINIMWKGSKDLSVPFFIQLGVTAWYYIAVGVCWMLVYSILLSWMLPIKIYVTGLILITLIWLVIGAYLARIDSGYRETTNKLKEEGETLQYYAEKMNVLASRYDKLCKEKGIQYSTDSNNRTVLDNLKNKISFLTPNVLKSETASRQLKTILTECEELIEQTGDAGEDKIAEVQKKMQRFVSNSIDEIDMLKKITRR